MYACGEVYEPGWGMGGGDGERREKGQVTSLTSWAVERGTQTILRPWPISPGQFSAKPGSGLYFQKEMSGFCSWGADSSGKWLQGKQATEGGQSQAGVDQGDDEWAD